MPPRKIEKQPVKSSVNIYKITNTGGVVFVPLKDKTLELVCGDSEFDEDIVKELNENLTCKAMFKAGRLTVNKLEKSDEETDSSEETDPTD